MIRLGTPHNAFALVIALCWTVAVVVWALSALFVKRTVERLPGWARLLSLVGTIWVFEIVYRTAGLRWTLWPQSAAVGVLADLLTIAGLAVALWARAVLGRNWSGRVVFKEDHELIQHGPYAYVRHPIYSGLLLMGLGTAVESGRLASFVLLAAVAVVLVVKAQLEERLMTSHFPEAYPQYRRRVKALIPGVW
jgi:protein-S-isoprenylcysteine O-methyltransferase Ste14